MSKTRGSSISIPIYTSGNVEIYPLAAAYPTVNSAVVGVWVWNAWREIVPAAGGIGVDFLIVGVIIYCVNAANSFEFDVQIGTGGIGAEAAIISLSKAYAQFGGGSPAIETTEYFALRIPRKVVANTRVSFRIAQSDNNVKTFRCEIMYVRLPI